MLAGLVLACGGEGLDEVRNAARWTVSSSPVATIGGRDDRLGYSIGRFAGATRLSDGRIAVADAGASEIRIYDSSGSHLATHGRRGQGPGEFQNILEMTRGAGDTLVVLSLGTGIAWLAPETGVAQEERFTVWSVSVPCRISESGWHVLPTGEMFILAEDNLGLTGCPARPPGVHRHTGLLARRLRGSEVLDTFDVLPATERDDGNFRALGHMLVLAIGPDRVFAGDTDADSILAYDFVGRRVGAYPVPFEPQPAPSSATGPRERRFTDRNGNEVVGDAYDYPELLPAFGRLVGGVDGSLWVMAYPTALDEPIDSWRIAGTFATYLPPGGTDWRVLDGTGAVIAEVHLPERFILLEVGADYVLGLHRDDLDVESVVVHALGK